MLAKLCELCGEPPSDCECGHCDVCDEPHDNGSGIDHCGECGNCYDHCSCNPKSALPNTYLGQDLHA